MKNRWIERRIFIPLILAGFWLFATESFAAGRGPKVTLNVVARTERNKNRKEDIRADVYGNDVTTVTDSEVETCTLTVEVKMRDQSALDCQLEWYFLSEKTKKARDNVTLALFDRGKKTIALQDKVGLTTTLSSNPFVLTKISSSSGLSDEISGDEYKGYIVLVTRDGEILAKASNSSRFLKEEWLSLCTPADK